MTRTLEELTLIVECLILKTVGWKNQEEQRVYSCYENVLIAEAKDIYKKAELITLKKRVAELEAELND